MEKQPTNRTITPTHNSPPATPLLPPSQAQKFTAKNIFYNSLPTLVPRELHLLPSIVGRGVEPKGGWGRQAVCVTLSDSLKREESAIRERGWGGVQTKHSTRF